MEKEIVNRYVGAFFRFVKKHGHLEKVQEDLERFVATCSQRPELLAFLENRMVDNTKKTHIIHLLAPAMQKETRYFFSLVIREKRSSLLGKMATAFIEVYKKSKLMCIVKVDAARPILPENREKIKKLITQLTPCQQIDIKERIIPQLIGGYVLHIGPYRLDASIQTKLNQLRKIWLSS